MGRYVSVGVSAGGVSVCVGVSVVGCRCVGVSVVGCRCVGGVSVCVGTCVGW